MRILDCRIAKPAQPFLYLSLASSVLFVFAGCGDPNPLRGATLYPVKGKVLVSDGKPFTSGKVIFIQSKTQITSGTALESDGGFAFKSANGDGLPAGEYRVILEPELSGGPKPSRGARVKMNLPFASKYTDEDGSDLKATVTSDESKNNFEFKLEARENVSRSAPSR
jgi:hypothetical protein